MNLPRQEGWTFVPFVVESGEGGEEKRGTCPEAYAGVGVEEQLLTVRCPAKHGWR